MNIPAPKGYSITVDQGDGLGSPWIVRVSRKSLLGKRRISSDWFLEREQAERYAHDAALLLESSPQSLLLKDRKPGWTLERSNH